jgi:lysophospholipase L1-like esterase
MMLSGISDDLHVLDPFYASLAKTDAKEPGAITRITHYGDSPITNDGITGTVRHELQVRFGDAGHGFILMDKPWAWYEHDAIRFEPSGSWSSEAIGPRSSPSMFGLGGVVTRSSGAGASTRFSTVAKGDTGRNFSHLDLYYLSQPGGGDLSIKVDSGQTQAITTATENTHSGFFDLRAPSPGENVFEITATRGEVTVFGAVLENDGPGIVYDSLGVNGAYAGLLMTAMDQQHWTEQLRHRNPNLVVLNYGTNESQYAGPDQIKHYEEQLREVVRRVHEALPLTPILIVSPMDRGELAAGGKIVTKPAIPMIVDMQRRVAREMECAFFDTYSAMGGEGTMAKWRTASPRLVRTDLTHPTAEGAATVGRLISNSILAGYEQYKSRRGSLISQ